MAVVMTDLESLSMPSAEERQMHYIDIATVSD